MAFKKPFNACSGAVTAGPFFSKSCCFCCNFKFLTKKARRLGVEKTVILSNPNTLSWSCFLKLSANSLAKVKDDFGGNSSVPNSNKKSFIIS